MEQTPHIALFQSPGMGHLIPLVELAKRVISQDSNFSVTIIIPTDGPLSKSQNTFLEALPSSINYVVLPPVNFDDLPDVRMETRISLTVSRSIPSLREVIKSLVQTTKLVALVVDLFGTDAFDIANEFKVSPYLFFAPSAMSLSTFLYLPKLDESVEGEFRDLPEPIQFPGCIPIHGKDLADPAQDRKDDAYKWLLHQAKRFKLAKGIMVNSFKELEEKNINSLLLPEPEKPPFYPIGPLIHTNSNTNQTDDSGCLRWLDDQPHSSVLYVSFGSGGTLSSAQFTELALGLEMSDQRFLWVIRSPNDKLANATYFGIQNQDDPFAFLPEGFLERTKGRGLVVPFWAPQAQILGHSSTGGFVCHCGWNSVLESVVSGVGLIAWPLYAEQRTNAVMLVEDRKIALRPKADENGLIGRAEIAKLVRNLMEGEEGAVIRNKMRLLKYAAAKALSEDGSSTKSLAELTGKWKQ